MTQKSESDPNSGCQMPSDEWAAINRYQFDTPAWQPYLAPFPPDHLLYAVSALKSHADFASHGADMWLAFSNLVDKPLSHFFPILDFGCGAGRLGRMFKGTKHPIYGCDIIEDHITWVNNNLDYYCGTVTKPDKTLPYEAHFFELVIASSVFTHINEYSQDFLLAEMHRICRPGAKLLISVHGERAMQRTYKEPSIWQMLEINYHTFAKAERQFNMDRLGFVHQGYHFASSASSDKNGLVTQPFPYGITFTPFSYIQRHWGQWFHIEKHVSGAIHDFQDIIVLKLK